MTAREYKNAARRAMNLVTILEDLNIDDVFSIAQYDDGIKITVSGDFTQNWIRFVNKYKFVNTPLSDESLFDVLRFKRKIGRVEYTVTFM